MRILIELSKNKEPVPYDYLPRLVGCVHKWIGPNTVHDKISLYSFCHLLNGCQENDHLSFRDGAKLIISSVNTEFLKVIISGIQKSPGFSYGMSVSGITIIQDPDLTNKTVFKCLSPVFIKRTIENNQKYYVYSDPEASQLLTETLLTKMKAAGIQNKTISIQFDPHYNNPKTKLILYNSIKIKSSICPVIIEGDPDAKLFAWNAGIGNSTGIGFGAIE